MNSWIRVFNDKRTWQAIDSLLAPPDGSERVTGCLPEELVFPLLQHISILPKAWNAIQDEHPDICQQRRERLAAKIREIADLIAADTDARHYRVRGIQSVTTSLTSINGIECPTVSDWLHAFSENVQRHESMVDVYAGLVGTKTTRNSLKEFVQREVCEAVDHMTGYPKRRPNKPIADLVSAVLGLTGEAAVKPNTIAKIQRRKPPLNPSINIINMPWRK